MFSATHRRGFSLLEVMLATIILLGAIVVLGELSRLGSRNVQAACAETEAERLAQSVLSRVVTAGVEPEIISGAPIEEFPGWLYSVEVEPLDRPSLSAVRITVSQDLPKEKQPVEFTVIRWMRTSSSDNGSRELSADEFHQGASPESASPGSTSFDRTPSERASPPRSEP